ncbi:AsmA family protein [Thalassospira sp.]|uniref:AsmA family protein n=1 Tax=Thalassospira sp. TaxID=1912094 RepID=UPI0027352095|nr:AsmA family protein [Thalassospira sp.]MDP2696725.1 AsmA family protein [Thalassospira sp.]
MKKILAVIGALLVVVIAALLIIPSMIDWNSYKSQISTAVRDATGRTLDIRGDLSMSLLPFPALSVNDVALSNVPGATDAEMVSVQEVRVSVALMPLLTGNVQVTEISLIDPVIAIETFADGNNNLVFGPAMADGSDAGNIVGPDTSTGDAPAPQQSAEPARSSDGDLASSVQIDRLSVENATIIYRSPGSEERIEGLTLDVTAGSLNGPLKGEGYVFYRGIPLTFNLDVGQISQTSAFPVALRVGIDKVKGSFDIGGQVDLSGDLPGFSGQLNASFDDLREAAIRIAGEGADIPDQAAKPFSLTGQLAANAKSVTVNDLTMRFGETRGTGALSIDQEPQLNADLALRFNQLDLDAILALAQAAAVEEDNAASAPVAATEQQDTTPDGLSIPSQGRVVTTGPVPAIPADLFASIDVEVDTLVYNQTPIHQARINAAIANSQMTVNEISANLPGGTSLSVFGSVSGAEPDLSADLRYEVASDNIRAVIRWLGADVDGIRADRLRRFSLTGGIKGSAAKLDISNVDMRIDDTAIRGAIVANMGNGGLPALGIGLKLDQINLDNYLPTPATVTANGNGTASGSETDSASSASGASALGEEAMLKAIRDALAPIKGLAANFRLGADEVVASGVRIRGIALDGSVQSGILAMNNFAIADAAGLSANAKGRFRGDLDVPGFESLQLDVTARNLESLVKLTGITLPAAPSQYNGVKAAVTLNGAITGPDIDLSVSNSVMQLAVKGVLQNVLGAQPGLNGRLTAQASDLNRALPLIAPEYQPSGNLGRLVFDGKVNGNAEKVAIEIAQLAIGQFASTGTVGFDASGARSKLDLALKGGTLKIDPFMPAARQASLAPRNSGMRRAAVDMPVSTLIRQVDARDGTPWDDAVIDVSALRSLDANITIALDQLDFDSFSLMNPDLAVNLDQGLMTINKMTGILGEGPLNITGTFDARSDTPKLALKGTLDQAQIAAIAPVRVVNDTIIGIASTNFDVAAAGNTSRNLVNGLNGTASVAMQNVRFSNADKRSADPKVNWQALLSQGPQAMVVEGIGNNDLLQTLDADMTITNGIAKTTRVDAVSRVGTADADATLDLPKWLMDAQADFDFSQKIEEVPPFSVFAKGKIDEPAISGRMDKLAINALQNLLGKALGGSGSSSSSGSESTDDGSSGKIKPKDVLKGILNQFGR